uniref:Mitochondrial resolvase Ydc2 catalytic domain-containing protein n=1 Tax=viral metagenome TaxID=1070528 RepID=A0A6C0LD89_9ZZZZ
MIILSFDVGIKNLAYCQLDSCTSDILDWNIIDCSVPKNGNVIVKLIEELESIPNLLESDTILIEKQPSFNPQMRIISTAIYVYFTLRLNYEKGTKTKILYYSAKNKLKLCMDTESIQNKNEQKSEGTLRGKKGKRKSYYYNKKAAIEQTKIFIEDNIKNKKSWYDKYLIFFNKSKKKDDLADSYLQALAYL